MVGAGVIGIEYASMFAALGVEVTLVEKRERPLEFLDHEIVDELIHQMRNRNVIFPPGRGGRAARGQPTGRRGGRCCMLESGKRIVSDLVLFSAGRDGATDRPQPAGGRARRPTSAGGSRSTSTFRTAVPHIFAAGDVIGYPSLAATSSEQGRLAACHAFGVAGRPDGAALPHRHLRDPRDLHGRARRSTS